MKIENISGKFPVAVLGHHTGELSLTIFHGGYFAVVQCFSNST